MSYLYEWLRSHYCHCLFMPLINLNGLMGFYLIVGLATSLTPNSRLDSEKRGPIWDLLTLERLGLLWIRQVACSVYFEDWNDKLYWSTCDYPWSYPCFQHLAFQLVVKGGSIPKILSQGRSHAQSVFIDVRVRRVSRDIVLMSLKLLGF